MEYRMSINTLPAGKRVAAFSAIISKRNASRLEVRFPLPFPSKFVRLPFRNSSDARPTNS